MSKLYNYKSLDMEFKDIDSGKREVVFQFAAYGNVDSYGDITMKGAFNRSINNNFGRIKHLLDHDTTKALGKPMEIWEDESGAYMRSKVGTHTLGNDFLEMATSGIITEASYGYSVVKEEKSKADGQDVNLLHEVKLYEASNLQAWGANEMTRLVSVQKAGGGKMDYAVKAAKRIEALEKFCKNTTASDETIELLLIEIKQLQSLVAEMLSTDSTEEVTPPDEAATKEQEQQESLIKELALLSIKLS